MTREQKLMLFCGTATLGFFAAMTSWYLMDERVAPNVEQLVLTIGMAAGGIAFIASVAAIITMLLYRARTPDPGGKEPLTEPIAAPCDVRGRSLFPSPILPNYRNFSPARRRSGAPFLFLSKAG